MAEDHEDFYDTEMGPVLLDLARRCQDKGVPFLASVQYGPEDFGTTINVPGQKSRELNAAYLTIRRFAPQVSSMIAEDRQ
jgi:hypothetical protein